MNTLLLAPTDVLFFRDGRPMDGSLAGHGAAWPLPSVTNSAVHAALHRADLDGFFEENGDCKVHAHDHRRGKEPYSKDSRKFGSLVTAGPFPVSPAGGWHFPRPLDAGVPNSLTATFKPLTKGLDPSSLPAPLKFPVVNTEDPSKDPIAPWWSQSAWSAYLSGETSVAEKDALIYDSTFSDTEASIGIGIDPSTGTQNGEAFYSAHYLRLRDDWKLGLVAEALDKKNDDPKDKRDLIPILFPNSGNQRKIITGGQQRICTVTQDSSAPLSLPLGQTKDFTPTEIDGVPKWLVKWALLTPAIFPAIGDHPGGWLPTWIDHQDGAIKLLDGPGKNAAKRRKVEIGQPIAATLVAAMTGKPVPVSGYALPHEAAETRGGPKPTHFAVPAGSVYYFQCDSEEAAAILASTLNWHANETTPETIRNRRSTLMGEKGFGLGVCAQWTPSPLPSS